VLGWCAATLTSVALASVAMLPVLRTATPDESALVSVDELRDSGEAGPTSPPPAPPGPTGTTPAAKPSGTPSPTSATASPSPSRTRTAPPSTPAPDVTTTRPAAAPTTTGTTTTEDGWTVTTNGDGDRSYVRSFRVEGGQTVIRMTPDRVRLVTATPADGYAVATVQEQPDNLAVYFNQPNHGFVIHAVWFNDRPFAEVSEIGT
jgi:hypothetical protein